METRAIDATTALLVATAALCCSVVVGCAFVLVVAAAGTKDLPGVDEPAAWCAAAALACASVAALIALTREAGGLRPGALAGAWLLAFAWPLSGAPVPAAAVATLATGLAVLWGADGARDRGGALAAALLAAAALELMTVAFAFAPDEGVAYRPPAEARASAAAGSAPPPPTARAEQASSNPAADRAPSPAAAVRAYYRALDRRDFGDAWSSLSPGVRASFGGFEHWRAGFATTLSSAPTALSVTTAGDGATVAHVLTARDSADCGVLVRQFSVQWRMRRTEAGWRTIALTAQPRDAASRCGA